MSDERPVRDAELEWIVHAVDARGITCKVTCPYCDALATDFIRRTRCCVSCWACHKYAWLYHPEDFL